MDRHYRLAFILVSLACLLASVFPLASTSPKRPFADLTPGVRYDAGPYVTPAGCIDRRWRKGEFMPTACLRGQTMGGDTIGLEHDAFMEYRPHQPWRYLWTRVGADAVLAECPLMTACKILQVVADRFVPRPGDSPLTQVADMAFRDPPLSYRLARHGHALILIPLAVVMLGLALLPGRCRRGVDDRSEMEGAALAKRSAADQGQDSPYPSKIAPSS